VVEDNILIRPVRKVLDDSDRERRAGDFSTDRSARISEHGNGYGQTWEIVGAWLGHVVGGLGRRGE